MNNQPMLGSRVFDLFEGIWTGEGHGSFPTITSFDFRETLAITRRDEKTLAYEQRAQKRYEDQTEWLASHWENGFIHILDNDELEMTSAQIGRVEVLMGKVEMQDHLPHIHFTSKMIANDPRMIASARTFVLNGDMLHYEMEMQTTAVVQKVKHLEITLRRMKVVS